MLVLVGLVSDTRIGKKFDIHISKYYILHEPDESLH